MSTARCSGMRGRAPRPTLTAALGTAISGWGARRRVARSYSGASPGAYGRCLCSTQANTTRGSRPTRCRRPSGPHASRVSSRHTGLRWSPKRARCSPRAKGSDSTRAVRGGLVCLRPSGRGCTLLLRAFRTSTSSPIARTRQRAPTMTRRVRPRVAAWRMPSA